MELFPDAASGALGRLARTLSIDAERLAEGALEVVNARMAALIRQITVGRGLDPRQFSIVAFGGAGPMHAVFLAEELGVSTVLVPHSPGTFSAHGMLEAEVRHDVVRPYFARWDRLDAAEIGTATQTLKESARDLLREDGIDPAKAALAVSADIRYVGQEHFLTLPAPRFDTKLLTSFHRTYKKTFGHSNPDELVEIVNLRLTAVATGGHARPDGSTAPSGTGKPYDEYPVRFRQRSVATPRFRRGDLEPGQRIEAPCIIDEDSCTTVVPDGWTVTADSNGWLSVQRASR
jgi:N-methylhydantoinase A